jgi:hypothetical protein
MQGRGTGPRALPACVISGFSGRQMLDQETKP